MYGIGGVRLEQDSGSITHSPLSRSTPIPWCTYCAPNTETPHFGTSSDLSICLSAFRDWPDVRPKSGAPPCRSAPSRLHPVYEDTRFGMGVAQAADETEYGGLGNTVGTWFGLPRPCTGGDGQAAPPRGSACGEWRPDARSRRRTCLCASTLSNWAADCSRKGASRPRIPALHTRMSRRPNASRAAPTAATTCSSEDTSVAT